MSRANIAWQMKQEGRKAAKDFPIDHTGMNTPETPRMVAIRGQIEELAAEYARLKESEQKRLYHGFLAVIRENAVEQYMRT